jgi:hypothetical protein
MVWNRQSGGVTAKLLFEKGGELGTFVKYRHFNTQLFRTDQVCITQYIFSLASPKDTPQPEEVYEVRDGTQLDHPLKNIP